MQNLGATFDSVMSMEPHTNMFVRNIFHHIRRIGRLQGHLFDGTTAKVIHTLMTSRLNIYNGILTGTSSSSKLRSLPSDKNQVMGKHHSSVKTSALAGEMQVKVLV